MAIRRGKRAAFGASTPRRAKTAAGRTVVARTPLNVRTSGVDLDDGMRDRVRSRLGVKLGKYAERIERVSVRFADEQRSRGASETTCTVKVVLSGLESVVFQARAADAPRAMSLAAPGIERAVRQALGREGGGRRASTTSTPRKKKTSSVARRTTVRRPEPVAGTRRGARPPEAGSLIGRRVGQGRANLEAALDRPEKRRRDQPIDTSQPGVSASDRRAGGGSTARRNTKRDASETSVALEDSARKRPSRRSTRKGANRLKPASNLQQRQVRRISSPKARASRSQAQQG